MGVGSMTPEYPRGRFNGLHADATGGRRKGLNMEAPRFSPLVVLHVACV